MKRIAFLSTATAILMISLSAGAVTGDSRTAGRGTVSETYRALDLFGDVFEQARRNYVDDVEDKKLIEHALNGMLSNLDPHSAYMNED